MKAVARSVCLYLIIQTHPSRFEWIEIKGNNYHFKSRPDIIQKEINLTKDYFLFLCKTITMVHATTSS